MTDRASKIAKAIDEWNRINPVGTYGNLTKDSGEVCTRVERSAYEMGGQVVAVFHGVSGCYLASRFHKDATND